MANYLKTPMADVLGGLLADAADTKTEVEAAKAQLIGMAAQDPNICVFEGDLFRATVTFANKRVVDYKAAIRELQARYEISQSTIDGVLRDCTQIAEGVPTVRCTARKGV